MSKATVPVLELEAKVATPATWCMCGRCHRLIKVSRERWNQVVDAGSKPVAVCKGCWHAKDSQTAARCPK
jgi:hypothetical protein